MSKEQHDPSESSLRGHIVFFIIVIAIIAAAIVRSNITTSVDSFTFDEAYHIGAGASYVQTHDFRLNPEHPPLVKLWVGAFVSAQGFQLSPFREFSDKYDERRFVEGDVFVNNDADLVQSRVRTAMFALNGLLFLLFAFAVRQVFGDIMAVAATSILAIDPTVAAHLPVVMTDLPVALLSSTAVLTAVAAFRSGRVVVYVLAAVALGLTLGAKHSGVVTLVAVALIGVVSAVFWMKGSKPLDRLKRLGAVAAVIVGAVVVLWSFYLFRFNESPGTSDEQFNRPLAGKVADIKTPVFRTGLNLMSDLHLFPRAYIWGMADTIRAGAEGNASSILFFGDLYYSKGPFYYFPAIIAVKLPLGSLLLIIIGAGLWVTRRKPGSYSMPLAAVLILATLFLAALLKGSSYAGIRHALPIIPPLALLGSLAIYQAVISRSNLLRGVVAVAFLGALISVVPVMRPWEYYNEAVGGTADGHRYFSDEGVDLGQRTKELVAYYNTNLKPNGDVPYVLYYSSDIEFRRRGLDWVGKDPERDETKLSAETRTGTFIIGARPLGPSLFWDSAAFRNAEPVDRMGSLFVYRGTFPTSPSARAASLFFKAIDKIYSPEHDVEGGIALMLRSAEADPSPFFVWLELGNQYLALGNREESLRTYKLSLEHAPKSDEVYHLLEEQIRRVEIEPMAEIAPLRNPGAE